MLQFGVTRNKESVILRPKIDKRNKRPTFELAPPLALENWTSSPGANSSIYGKYAKAKVKVELAGYWIHKNLICPEHFTDNIQRKYLNRPGSYFSI